jgi:predicted Fe-Mo cluster-binding NifX family protein
MKKIAVSSQNFRTITGHAGKARRFIIYEVKGPGEVEEVERLDLPKTMSMHNTLESSPHPLDEMDALITAEAGEGFLRKMARRGVEVHRTSASDPLLAAMSLAAGEDLPPLELDASAHHGHGHGGGGHGHGGGGCGCGH